MGENKRFNRYERNGIHVYSKQFGSRGDRGTRYTGYVKCKLVHRRGESLIIPDQVYLDDGDALLWFQPLAYMANELVKTPEDIGCALPVDVSMGQSLLVTFEASAHVRSYADGAHLYRCVIQGPAGLASYATGRARLSPDGLVYVDLYHHTDGKSKSAILKSRLLRGSAWNIRGTHRVENIAYGYLTPLDRIATKQDLYEIAMASEGFLRFQRDNVVVPDLITTEWLEAHRDDVLQLSVYRENTVNRRATVRLSVDAAALAPQHVLRHDPWGSPVYFEVSNPMVHRVGLQPGTGAQFNRRGELKEQADLKRFGYLVVGDATSLAGLAAPYDEETTEQVYKIEITGEETDLLNFWFDNANQDLFTGRDVEFQRLSPMETGA
jgi:hypothetical protein